MPRSWVIRMIERPRLVADVHQQPQDLRLDGHVERRGRLVGDQDLRIAGQRRCDHRALAHATGELVRIAVVLARRVGEADLRQHLDRRRARGAGVRAPGGSGCPSAIWSPIRITGSRWLVGFWKIMPISPPRTSSISASDAVVRSRPSSVTEPPLILRRGEGSRRTSERQSRLLPEPLSPTRPRISPWPRSSDTASISVRVPPSPSCDDGEVADLEQRRAHSCTPKQVGEAVADQAEGEGERRRWRGRETA